MEILALQVPYNPSSYTRIFTLSLITVSICKNCINLFVGSLFLPA